MRLDGDVIDGPRNLGAWKMADESSSMDHSSCFRREEVASLTRSKLHCTTKNRGGDTLVAVLVHSSVFVKSIG